MTALEKARLYRMPWSLYDNPIGWVEVTDECNMHCKGCYRTYIETHEGHKSVEDIKKEVLFMRKVRNVCEISLAGGEPLLHPHITDIVKYISNHQLGVNIFSNGLDITQELIHQLALAGLSHITFHVDTSQTRNDKWDNCSEIELNSLRQFFVDLCQKEKHAVRSCQIVEEENNPKMLAVNQEDNVSSEEIYDIIKKCYPKYEISAYFGGTTNPKSFKWLFSVSLCSSGQILGSIGAISIELSQVLRHLIYGRYIINDPYKWPIPSYLINLICIFCDRNIQKALFNLIRRPRLLNKSVHLLRLIVIQGHDIPLSGDMDMCDGCPDMTYFRGRLVNSCRLDEFRKYGRFITGLRKEK
jgi:organic radical activating enzyme